MAYYRPTDINPNWLSDWVERITEGKEPLEVLDELCQSAVGVNSVGAPDIIQKYASHIHAHLLAALKVGMKFQQMKLNADLLIEDAE